MDDIEQSNQVTIRDLESVRLPLTALRAAATIASDDDQRGYMNGVYVHARNGEYRIVARDGARMFVHSTPIPAKLDGDSLPAWLLQGVTIPRDGLKERLGLLDKLDCSTAEIAYQIDAPQVVISDRAESCIFKMQPKQTWPDYQEWIDSIKAFEARESEEMASVAYDSSYLKGVGDLAKGWERAERQFRADINAELSADHGGLTVGQLADGVPIDDWFTTGLSPAEAATRCLDWRRIAAVLPADEVLPGEADLPAGLLTSPARDEIAGESEPTVESEPADEEARAAE